MSFIRLALRHSGVMRDISSNVFLPDDLAAHEHAHDGGCHPPARPAGEVAEAVETADVRVEIGVHLHAVGAELPLGGAEQRFVRGKARHDRIAFQRKRRFPQAMRSISGRNGTLPPPIKAAGTARRKEKRTVQPKLNRPFDRSKAGLALSFFPGNHFRDFCCAPGCSFSRRLWYSSRNRSR